MTNYRQKVLEAVRRCPGAGPCNVCDYVGGMEGIDILNASRALNFLRERGWINADGYCTEAAEKFLDEKSPVKSGK